MSSVRVHRSQVQVGSAVASAVRVHSSRVTVSAVAASAVRVHSSRVTVNGITAARPFQKLTLPSSGQFWQTAGPSIAGREAWVGTGSWPAQWSSSLGTGASLTMSGSGGGTATPGPGAFTTAPASAYMASAPGVPNTKWRIRCLVRIESPIVQHYVSIGLSSAVTLKSGSPLPRDGYAVQLFPAAGGFNVQRVLAANATQLGAGGDTAYTYPAGGKLWVEMERAGAQINVRLWAKGSARPSTPTFTGADSAPLATGLLRAHLTASNGASTTAVPVVFDELTVENDYMFTPAADRSFWAPASGALAGVDVQFANDTVNGPGTAAWKVSAHTFHTLDSAGRLRGVRLVRPGGNGMASGRDMPKTSLGVWQFERGIEFQKMAALPEGSFVFSGAGSSLASTCAAFAAAGEFGTLGALLNGYPDGQDDTYHFAKMFPSKTFSNVPGVGLNIRQRVELVNGVSTALGGHIHPVNMGQSPTSGAWTVGPYGRKEICWTSDASGPASNSLGGFGAAAVYIAKSGTPSPPAWPGGGEMDGEEGGTAPIYAAPVKGYYHVADDPGGRTPIPFSTVGSDRRVWHTNTIEWEPGLVTVYHDGVQTFQSTDRVSIYPWGYHVQCGSDGNGVIASNITSLVKIAYVASWAYIG